MDDYVFEKSFFIFKRFKRYTTPIEQITPKYSRITFVPDVFEKQNLEFIRHSSNSIFNICSSVLLNYLSR